MNNQSLKTAVRSSPLALVQVDEIQSLLGDAGVNVSLELVKFDSKGDQDKKKLLTDNDVPDNFFTDTLDAAVINGQVDLAIHSAKDLPEELDSHLRIVALTESRDSTDAFVGSCRFNQLSNGARIGTSSRVRQQQLLQINPHVKIVQIRGTIQERLQLIDDGVIDGAIIASIALKRLGLENRITDLMPWEGAPLQGQLAVVARADNDALRAMFMPLDVRRQYGRVILAGAGPGDPKLITLKAIEALQQCDCVFFDYLVDKSLLNYCAQAEQVYVGKRKGAHSLAQDELSRQLRVKAMEGKNTVRLKGGDPLIFGRGAEEIDYLKSYHIQVSVIPGVSSPTGVPSAIGLPLTARGISSSVAFISGHSHCEVTDNPQPIDIPQADTLVFLMGLTKLEAIVQTLKKNQWSDQTPMMIVSRGTYADQQILQTDLSTILEKASTVQLRQPALIVVGKSVAFWQRHFSKRQTILYTGTHPETVAGLGEIVHFPLIAIQPAKLSAADVQQLIAELDDYHMILLTSRFAVIHLMNLLKSNDVNASKLQNKDWIVIGQATNDQLESFGLTARLQSPVETSEGLFSAMKSQLDLKGKRILFPRSSLPNPYLKTQLEAAGARVDQITIYENHKPAKRPLPKKSFDQIVFTSPSTVKNFLTDYQTIPGHWEIICKGPVTREYLMARRYSCKTLFM